MVGTLENWHPVNLIQFLLVAQCLLFCLFLFSQKKAYGLASFLLAMALHMIFNILEEVAALDEFPKITHSFGFLYGPFLWLFVKEMCYRDFSFQAKYTLHVIPFIFALPLPYFFPSLQIVLGPSIVISIIYYFFQSFSQLSKYHRVLEQTQSGAIEYRLDWLSYFMAGLLVISFIDFIRHFAGFTGQASADGVFYVVVLSSVLGSVTYLLLRALKQPNIFAGIQCSDEEVLEDRQTPQLKPASESEQLTFQKISDFVTGKRRYLDPSLSLNQLAKELTISAREISRLVNLCTQRNFSDFINHFRVLHVCHELKLPSNAKRKLLDILLSSGFNSKSSFNAIFKKEMKMTPTQYRSNSKE